VEPHGQEPVAPAVRRNPPKLQSFAKASEDTRIPPRLGGRGFLRRRVNISDGYLQRGWTARGREIGKIPQDSNLIISMVYYFHITELCQAMIGKSDPNILKIMILPVLSKISQMGRERGGT
jgi:hypothetical protein